MAQTGDTPLTATGRRGGWGVSREEVAWGPVGLGGVVVSPTVSVPALPPPLGSKHTSCVIITCIPS